ncbi:glycosyltransferase [Seonamhaeicola sp. ML3]|uniref:glycosyltransferase n=1 Tax=Seonamhaeicola sp. ML3 TaxID=2937786 RepID=UPI0020107142|nr:glycosyltransferase [Seonamhaeicola sp. ML3]
MKLGNIYVLHERGAKSHFIALEYYGERFGKTIIYREFSIIRFMLKSILRLDISLFYKQVINSCFIVNLIFSKDKTIILGIAPLDWRLLVFNFLLKKHKVLYFTSWTCWDGTFFPKKKFENTPLIRNVWKLFLEETIDGLFCVTSTGLQNLKNNYNINCPYNVVGHSVEKFELNEDKETEKVSVIKLIYVGRLVKEKGIFEMFELLKKINPEKFSLTIVGDGKLAHLAKSYSERYTNIYYKGFVSSKKDLFDLYKGHDIQLLFSRKSMYWEELFGMVITEAMSQGVITISTQHSGPEEIIEDSINGFLIPDDKNLVDNARHILMNKLGNLPALKKNAKNESNKYFPENLYVKWKELLNE